MCSKLCKVFYRHRLKCTIPAGIYGGWYKNILCSWTCFAFQCFISLWLKTKCEYYSKTRLRLALISDMTRYIIKIPENVSSRKVTWGRSVRRVASSAQYKVNVHTVKKCIAHECSVKDITIRFSNVTCHILTLHRSFRATKTNSLSFSLSFSLCFFS